MTRAVIVVAFVAALAVLACASTTDYTAMFTAFKAKYARTYANADEEAKRLAIFTQNMKTAANLKKVNPLATFGVNEFADQSAEEFKIRHNAEKFYAKRRAEQAKKPAIAKMYTEAEVIRAGSRKIDWRQKGAVTPVKNQEQCGSCWAFSTTGGIEGQWFLAGNPLTSLSEQELVSCDTIDSGCNGGLMDQAFTWLLQAHQGQIVTEASYPYVSGNGIAPACNMNNKKVGATIANHKDLPHDEGQMATWVYSNGPLSIAVDATSWQTYNNGILTNCISDQIDHGVLIVGFDDTNSPPYWIVKNSWGTSWGESGYIRIGKGTDQCLITDMPSTSIVSGGPPPPPPGPTPPPPPPTPATPPYVMWTYNQTSAAPPGYTIMSINDFKSDDFVTYYNANGMTDLGEYMSGCCTIAVQEGYLVVGNVTNGNWSFFGPYTAQQTFQCISTLSNPVWFGTEVVVGPFANQYIGQLDPVLLDMVGTVPSFILPNYPNFCTGSVNSWGLYKQGQSSGYVIGSTANPPSGYSLLGIDDITGSDFVNYYNANGLQTVGSLNSQYCCVINTTDGYLTFGPSGKYASYVAAFTASGSFECQTTVQAPVWFGTAPGAGRFANQYIGSLNSTDVELLGATSALYTGNGNGCSASADTWGIFTSSSNKKAKRSKK